MRNNKTVYDFIPRKVCWADMSCFRTVKLCRRRDIPYAASFVLTVCCVGCSLS